MAEIDVLTIILPTVFASIVTFVVLGIKKMGNTSDGTLSGTIKLENVQTNMEGIEKKMDKGFERIEQVIQNNDKENRQVFNKVWDRIEQVNSDLRLHEYRISEIDRRFNQGDHT